MLELIKAGGFLMWPIIACSVISVAIVLERLWAYQTRKVIPDYLLAQIWQLHQKGEVTAAHIATIRDGSPLGRILAAGLVNRNHSREIMKESIEEEGRQVVHELDRYLNTLGTVAAI